MGFPTNEKWSDLDAPRTSFNPASATNGQPRKSIRSVLWFLQALTEQEVASEMKGIWEGKAIRLWFFEPIFVNEESTTS